MELLLLSLKSRVTHFQCKSDAQSTMWLIWVFRFSPSSCYTCYRPINAYRKHLLVWHQLCTPSRNSSLPIGKSICHMFCGRAS